MLSTLAPRLQAELTAAIDAMHQGNTAQADGNLRNAEAAVVVIEKFLGNSR